MQFGTANGSNVVGIGLIDSSEWQSLLCGLLTFNYHLMYTMHVLDASARLLWQSVELSL